MDRKKWLLLIPVAVMISGIIVLQNIPKRGEETYIYLDDVSIAVDGVEVFQDDARNETAPERWKTIEHAQTTEDVYLSPPSSFALRCAESRKGGYGTLYPRVDTIRGWDWLNVTWSFKVPEEALPGRETRHDLSVFFDERGEGRMRLGCVVRLSEGSNSIWATAVYFGDQAPHIHDEEREIDFDSSRWHRLTLFLEKPLVKIYFDGTIACDFPIYTEYLTEEIEFRWWAYYNTM